MKITGKIHLLGDNISCDSMISGKYILKSSSIKELIPFLMEDVDETFAEKLERGDILVAGENFGCGSTRSHAVLLMKEAGIACIISKKFSRGFFRNGINEGMILIEADWYDINPYDIIEVDLEVGKIKIVESDKTFDIKVMPNIMKKIMMEDGLISYYNKCGKLQV